MKEIFITTEMFYDETRREFFNVMSEGNSFQEYDTYPEAVDAIKELQPGDYQIQKVFRVEEDNIDWDKAYNDLYVARYSLPSNMILKELCNRYYSGERTRELYDDIKSVL